MGRTSKKWIVSDINEVWVRECSNERLHRWNEPRREKFVASDFEADRAVRRVPIVSDSEVPLSKGIMGAKSLQRPTKPI